MITSSGTAVCENRRRLCSQYGRHGSARKDSDADDENGSPMKMPFSLLSEEPEVSIYVEESRLA